MYWEPIPRPAELAETRLLEAILSGYFPINTTLPGERGLAAQLGVTRPTLREALQRLARDGWLEIQHGKPTRVCDYWREGSLAVLSALAQTPAIHPPDFVAHLLEIRYLLAPEYTFQALTQSPLVIASHLKQAANLPEEAGAFVRFDWDLHRLLTQHAGNPIYCLLLNSFQGVYTLVGERYFACEECRQHSRDYYRALHDCSGRRAADDASRLTRRVMQESLALWKANVNKGASG